LHFARWEPLREMPGEFEETTFGYGVNHVVDDNAALMGCRTDDPEMRESGGNVVHDSIAHHFFLRDCSRAHRFNEMGCILTAREAKTRPKLAGWFPRSPARRTGTMKSENALREQARNQRFDPLLRMGTVMTGRSEQWDEKDAADSARRRKLAGTVAKQQAFKNSYPALRWTQTGYLQPGGQRGGGGPEEGGAAEAEAEAEAAAARGTARSRTARSGTARSARRPPAAAALPPPVDDRDWVLQPTAHPPRHDREGFLHWSAGGAVEAAHEPTPRWTTTNMSMSRHFAPRAASARRPPRCATSTKKPALKTLKQRAAATARPATAAGSSRAGLGSSRASAQRPQSALPASSPQQRTQRTQRTQRQPQQASGRSKAALISMRSRRDEAPNSTSRSLRQSKQALQARLREVDAMLAKTSCFSARSSASRSER
jgi:hypothetical protein